MERNAKTIKGIFIIEYPFFHFKVNLGAAPVAGAAPIHAFRGQSLSVARDCPQKLLQGNLDEFFVFDGEDGFFFWVIGDLVGVQLDDIGDVSFVASI